MTGNVQRMFDVIRQQPRSEANFVLFATKTTTYQILLPFKHFITSLALFTHHRKVISSVRSWVRNNGTVKVRIS